MSPTPRAFTKSTAKKTWKLSLHAVVQNDVQEWSGSVNLTWLSRILRGLLQGRKEAVRLWPSPAIEKNHRPSPAAASAEEHHFTSTCEAIAELLVTTVYVAFPLHRFLGLQLSPRARRATDSPPVPPPPQKRNTRQLMAQACSGPTLMTLPVPGSGK